MPPQDKGQSTVSLEIHLGLFLFTTYFLFYNIELRGDCEALSLPGGSVVRNCLPVQEMWVQSLDWEDSWGKK